MGDALPFMEIKDRVKEAVSANAGLAAFIYSPKSGKVHELSSPEKTKELFAELAENEGFDPGAPLYLIGTTNSTDADVEKLRAGYDEAATQCRQPMFSYSKTPAGATLNVVLAKPGEG